MGGHELWKALADASDEVGAAMSEYRAGQTPRTSTRIEKAIREYMDCLVPVIGAAAAFQFHASWETYIAVADRQTRLLAALSGQPRIDDADAAMLQELEHESQAAMAAHESAQAALRVQLDAAAERDEQIRVRTNDVSLRNPKPR